MVLIYLIHVQFSAVNSLLGIEISHNDFLCKMEPEVKIFVHITVQNHAALVFAVTEIKIS
jgi:hypothetical protein